MNKVAIAPNKHIALIFRPRSGSHILRKYLSATLGIHNFGEIFNLLHDFSSQIQFTDDNPPRVKVEHLNKNFFDLSQDNVQELQREVARKNIATLNKLTELGEWGVFGIHLSSFDKFYPELLNEILSRSDIQPIRLQRKDILYGMLSIMVSVKSEFHNYDTDTIITRPVEPFEVEKTKLIKFLDQHVRFCKNMDHQCPELPIIYYEQFQQTPTQLMNLFTGLPRKLVSIPYSRWGGNYRDLVTNIEEVEAWYSEYQSEHPEYSVYF